MDATVPKGAAPSLVLPPLKQIASPNFSSRGGRAIDLIVIHDCEGGYASAISWFGQTASQVSAHIVLREDGLEAVQMVAFSNKAWHAVAFNPRSIGIEMAGFAAKGFSGAEWQAEAGIVAYLLHKYGLPCRWAANGQGEGFCSHYDLGAAGGGHHDPTTNPIVWQSFVARVTEAYAQPMPASWGSEPAHAPSAVPRHDLPPGSLEWTQSRLNVLGYAVPALSVDGMMGPKTRAAIAAFQTARGIPAGATAQTTAALAA